MTVPLIRAGAMTFLMCATIVQLSAAQDYPTFSAGAVATTVNTMSVVPNGSARMDGKLYGGEGLVTWRFLSLRASYAQGKLGIGSSVPGGTGDPADGGIVGLLLGGVIGGAGGSENPFFDLNIVDANATLGVIPISGLEIASGLKGRARYTDDESERLLLWIVRARYETPIISPQLRAYVEGWNSFAGSATAPDGSASGRGGSAGMIAGFGPVLARLSYGIDRERYGDDIRRETMDGLGIGIGWRIR